MAFVNFSLLFGGLLLALPIVLHLVMRQQPKQLIFPALRFVKQRQDANRRQLQLRHWLLLLLRCLAIAMLAAVLARPSVPSMALGDWILIGLVGTVLLLVGLLAVLALLQRRGRWVSGGFGLATVALALALAVMLHRTLARDESATIGNERAPVAAVLVFDTSPRMQYLRQNHTRLDQAREIAHWLIRQLPGDSEVAVVDSRPGGAAFAVDLAAAQRSIERLETTGVPSPLTDVAERAVKLAQTSQKPRKEVYLFSDLSRASWMGPSSAILQEQQRANARRSPSRMGHSSAILRQRLQESGDVLLYVIDVGVDQPQNMLLGVPSLPSDVLAKSNELEVQTKLECLGPGGTNTVELYLEEPDPELPVIRDGKTVLPASKLRAQQVVTVPDDGSQLVRFHVSSLDAGTQQGTLRISGQDGLAWDNTRYFTVAVQEASPVLVLAPPTVITKFFVEAIAPYEFRQRGRARVDVRVEEQARWPNLALNEYAAVCILDPVPLTPSAWETLTGYVRNGGGLALFLGHNADTTSFNIPTARKLTGGKLDRQWRSPGDVFLTIRDLSHPMTAAFRDLATSVPWDRFPVYRHWGLEEIAPPTRVIVRYSNNQAAIIETPLGRGRVLTMTTPVSDPAQLQGRQTWNELPTGSDAWPYLVLVNEMVRYLTDAGGTKLNYLAGETAALPNARDKEPERYQLFTPLDQPQDVTAAEGQVVVKFTELPGAYRLKGFLQRPVVRGFSVNLPESASQLTRLAREDLDELLGAGRYHFARSQDEIVLGVGEARMGREFYPFLLPLLALILGLEHLLANRFYRRGE
ncbi:MAG TPA: BatA domain-containing protein [Candidatus Anammoximicrobium sp.]|nr:BatA domain-containing protein [Candidatus Anammoximicrobium sp.]